MTLEKRAKEFLVRMGWFNAFDLTEIPRYADD